MPIDPNNGYDPANIDPNGYQVHVDAAMVDGWVGGRGWWGGHGSEWWVSTQFGGIVQECNE